MGTAVTGIKLQRMYMSDGGTQWEGDTAGTSYRRTSRRGFNTAMRIKSFRSAEICLPVRTGMSRYVFMLVLRK